MAQVEVRENCGGMCSHYILMALDINPEIMASFIVRLD